MRSEKVFAHGIFKVKGKCYFESEKSFWGRKSTARLILKNDQREN